MSLDDSVEDFVGIGEHAVGEEEGGSVVRAGRVRDEEREERRDGVDLVAWPARRNRRSYIINFTDN